jgi:RNA polymerase sigma-70 factor, ECF subfamily
VSDVEEAITWAYHDQWARSVVAMTSHFGDLDIADNPDPGVSVLR